MNEQKATPAPKYYAVEEREIDAYDKVTIDGQDIWRKARDGRKEKIYIRELSSGEVEGVFVGVPKGERDSKANFKMRKEIVCKAVCNLTDEENMVGVRRFANEGEVDRMPNSYVNLAFGEAAEVNHLGKNEAKAGKGSGETDTPATSSDSP